MIVLGRPLRWPRFIGRLICRVLASHEDAYNAEKTWRFCYRCRREERRVPGTVWKD